MVAVCESTGFPRLLDESTCPEVDVAKASSSCSDAANEIYAFDTGCRTFHANHSSTSDFLLKIEQRILQVYFDPINIVFNDKNIIFGVT